METGLLLIKIITMLYHESLLGEDSDNSAEYVQELLETIPTPVETMDGDDYRAVQIALRRTIRWMCSRNVNSAIDITDLKQRLISDCGNDSVTLKALEEGIFAPSDLTQSKRISVTIYKEIRKQDGAERAKKLITSLARPIMYGDKDIDINAQINKLVEELTQMDVGTSEHTDPAVVTEMSVSDVDKVANLFGEAQKESSLEGVLKTGWHGLNRMLGEVGGFRRSEFVVLGALQHNYKTGFTMDLARQIAIYNKPFMLDPRKKPMIMHISAENAATDNIVLWWKKIMAQRTGISHDHLQVSREDAATTVAEELGKMGYEFNFCRVNPSMFGYRNLFARIKEYESQGYEIHCIVCDYLAMFDKSGCEKGPHGQEIRDLYRRVRNFTTARKICFITPHQLSPAAKELVRGGAEEDLPKLVVNKGYWDGCTKIDQEVDVEIIIHKVILGEDSYLCVQRGKHRTISITPEKDKYFVYKFEGDVGILDDINEKDKSRRTVGSKSNSDGGGSEWYGFDD